MHFQIRTISRKKFLLFVFAMIIVSCSCGVGLGVYFKNGIVGALLAFILVAISFYFAHQFALKIINVSIGENSISVENKNIMFENIFGYFVDVNTTLTAIDIKLKTNEIVNLTGITLGKQKIIFNEFTTELIKAIKLKSSSAVVLDYFDVHPRQAFTFKPLIFIVIIINLIAIYFFVTKDFFTWKIFLFNTIAFGMILNYKRK